MNLFNQSSKLWLNECNNYNIKNNICSSLNYISTDIKDNFQRITEIKSNNNVKMISLSTFNNNETMSLLHLYSVTIVSCIMISLSSMLMLLLFLYVLQRKHKNSSSSNSNNFDIENNEYLKLILAFAVGALLADVFLHLLPESCEQLIVSGYAIQNAQNFIGHWILVGIILFASIESIISLIISMNNDSKSDYALKNKEINHKMMTNENENSSISNGKRQNGMNLKNRQTRSPKKNDSLMPESLPLLTNNDTRNVTAYINLLANGFDNFTHGMSVAASFSINYKIGIMTTIAITLHEMPHEIVDFIILMRSGFTCWRAFKAQLSITIFTIIGNLTVLYFDKHYKQMNSMSLTLWILPLTSGGFIYIALTSLLPELLSIKNNNDNESSMNGYTNNKLDKPKNRKNLRKISILLMRIVFIIFGVITMESINAIDL